MDQIGWWFNGWEPIGRVAVVGTLAYLSIITLLRVARKRTLSQLTALDFVIVVAIGSAFGRILTARHVALAEAVAAFTLLTALQFGFSWLLHHSPRVARILVARPSLLFYKGEFVRDTMRKERVTEDNIREAARHHGVGSLHLVEAVVLESTGTMSVIKKGEADDFSLVEGRPDA